MSIRVCSNRVAKVNFEKGGEDSQAFFEEQGYVILNGGDCEQG